MSRPRQTIITYDADGNVDAIDHRIVMTGTVDYGDGAEPIEKESQDVIGRNLIGAATRTAAQAFLDAFEVDIATERQRVADQAAAAAARAAARAGQ